MAQQAVGKAAQTNTSATKEHRQAEITQYTPDRQAAGMRPVSAAGSVCPCEGNCPRCNTAPANPALTVGQENSVEEKEAERMADVLERQRFGSGTAPPPGDGEESTPPKRAVRQVAPLDGEPGKPLPLSWQQQMRNHFNLDFNRVQVHTGAEAARLSKSYHAAAFTHGNHIYFQQDPANFNRRNESSMLAHELTHVAQQSLDNQASVPDIQCLPERVIFRPTPESAIIIYRSIHGLLRQGMTQHYSLALHNLESDASELNYLWLVYDDETDEVIYREETEAPEIDLQATRQGNFRLAVVIMQNGRLFTHAHDGIVVQVNETVLPDLETEIRQMEANARALQASHNMPGCDGPVLEITGRAEFDLGSIPPPTANCSFTPLYHIMGRSVRITAHVENPPDTPGQWSMTTFECPVGFTNEHACERGYGVDNLVYGSVTQDLTYHYDPLAWTTQKIFLRFRNGHPTEPLNVHLTLDPDIPDPMLETIHSALQWAGLLPVIGIVPDGLDLLLYVAEGRWGEAAVSAAAMVPAFGEGATVTRIGSRDLIRMSRREIAHMGEEGLRQRIRRRLDLIRQGLAENPTRPERVIPTGQLAHEQRQLERLSRQVDNFLPVTDEALRRQGYQVELHLGDGVVYRRRIGGVWCRFHSPADCGLWIGDEIERRAVEAIGENAPGGVTITTNPRRLEQEPVRRTRPEGQPAHPEMRELIPRGRAFQAGRRVLRSRLERRGMGFPGHRWEAHHIIPWEFQDHEIFQFLRRRARGWDHNSPLNGIALPMEEGIPGAEHLPLHQATGPGTRFHQAYNWRVYSRLREIYERWDNVRTPPSERITDSQLRGAVMDLIQELRDEFYEGDMERLL